MGHAARVGIGFAFLDFEQPKISVPVKIRLI